MILKATSIVEGTKHDFATFDDYVNEKEHIEVKKGYIYVIDKATRVISDDYTFRFKGRNRDYGDITFIDKDTKEVVFNVCPQVAVYFKDPSELKDISRVTQGKSQEIADEFIKAVIEAYEGKVDVVADKEPKVKVVDWDCKDGRLIIPLRDILDDKNE